MEAGIIALILIVLFFSTLIRSTFGFGDALVAMPLLSLIIDIRLATPLVAVIALGIAFYIFLHSRKEIKFSEIKKLLIPTLIGIPIGVIYLKNVNEDIIKFILALILIVFASFKLISTIQYKPIKPGYAYIFGLISGLLGGAYNTNGPPLIIFGTLRNWSAASFRATLQGIFLPVNSFIVINHIAGGLWSFELLKILLYTLPVIIPSIFLGGFLHRKISTEKFHRYIYLFLIIIGIVLLVSIFTS